MFSLAVLIHISISLEKIITTSAPDFHVFYQSAYDVVHAINPYEDRTLPTGFGYPVATSILYVPFLIVPRSLAQGLFIVGSAVSVPIIVYLCLQLTKRFSWSYFLVFTSLAFLSFPVKFTLGMGQSNLVAFLLLLLSFFFYKKRMLTMSGIFLGLSIVMKPLIAFLLLFFLFNKAWKVIVIAIVVAIGFILPTLFIFGTDIYVYYFTQFVPHLLNVGGREIYYNQGIMGFVARLTDNLMLRKIVPFISSVFLISFISFFMLKNKLKENMQFALLLSVLVLIDTLAWQHHFVFLIFPYILIATWMLEKRMFGQLTILVISYILVGLNIKNSSSFSTFPYTVFLSHAFYGAVILLCLLFFHALKVRKL